MGFYSGNVRKGMEGEQGCTPRMCQHPQQSSLRRVLVLHTSPMAGDLAEHRGAQELGSPGPPKDQSEDGASCCLSSEIGGRRKLQMKPQTKLSETWLLAPGEGRRYPL